MKTRTKFQETVMTYKNTFNNNEYRREKHVLTTRKQACTRHLTESTLTYCIVLNILVTTVHIVRTKELLQYCFKNESMTGLVQDYQWINTKG